MIMRNDLNERGKKRGRLKDWRKRNDFKKEKLINRKRESETERYR